MGNSEKLPNTSEVIDEELAKDIARLYNWAQVEGASYRDFSRQRKPRHIRTAQDQDIEENPDEIAAVSEPGAGNLPSVDISQAAPVPEQPLIVVETSASQVSTNPIQPEPVNSVTSATAEPVLRDLRVTPLAEGISPALAVYSLAGGVGKTTFCASLGRVLCSLGEQVLLVDASVSGLLPFYFGAADLRTGLRTFLAPEPHYPPLQVLGVDEVTREWLDGDVKAAMLHAQRTIFDLGPASMSGLPEIFGMCGLILIPLLPDLNSILTVSRIEASLKTMKSRGIQIPPAFYLFNRFDEDDPMHQQARGLVQRQCGEHLLSMTIHSGAEIAQAIASRMTVADHAPESDVTRDFMEVASWVRKVAPVHLVGRAPGRWSER
jgi:cellulose biosynthesis protein BcsQ